jgi:HK97 family phage prohead protease
MSTPRYSAAGLRPLELRQAEVVDVSESRRLVELIVMPYERPALVPHAGRMIEEVCARGAFTWGEATRVNRDHRLERTVGAVESFRPDEPDGLGATLRIARTPLGDETLELAAAGCLDGSAGFRPVEARWERGETTARRRRLLRAFLAHIALTPEPAYAEARVTAVRAWHLEREAGF